MNSILKVSEAAALALHTVSLLARHPGQRFSNTEIAELLGCSSNTLSKVLQRLTKAGIVSSVRGPNGGFELSVDPDEANTLDVYEAVDGKLAACTCLLGNRYCNHHDCELGALVQSIHQTVADSFSKLTLTKLATSMKLGDEIYGDPEHN